jgi:hypothetical protein
MATIVKAISLRPTVPRILSSEVLEDCTQPTYLYQQERHEQ